MKLATVVILTACLLTLPPIVSPFEWDYQSDIEQNTVDSSLDSPTDTLSQSDSRLTAQPSKSKFEVGFNAGFNTGIKGLFFCSRKLTTLIKTVCTKAKKDVKLKLQNRPRQNRKRRRRKRSPETYRTNYHQSKKLSRRKRRSRILNTKKFLSIKKRFNEICCFSECDKLDQLEIYDTCRIEHDFRRWFLKTLFQSYLKSSRNSG
jgi:hypothetical protein